MSPPSGGQDPPDLSTVPAKSAWGSTRPRGSTGSSAPSYSSITSINTSVRDSKNILEVRLEKQEGSKFNLSMEEIEYLLRRLNIDSPHIIGVSACPEGRPVVLITLHPSVDINRFLYRNESYVVKEGVRTTTIRPEGKKEKLIKITGLHPNTKDQAVLKYLTAHATVSPCTKVIHHVFPGDPGSGLLVGKLNGNRSYVVELKMPMGSYHIIDGEKVSVRYSGQEWSCARCHQYKKECPGAAVAKDCTAERVMLSTHMKEHWEKIGYRPEVSALNDVDKDIELEVQFGRKEIETNPVPESILSSKYHSVIVKGFRLDTPMEKILEILTQHGLPEAYNTESLVRNENTGSITVDNLEPKECLSMTSRMHKKQFLRRQIFVTSVVASSPVKQAVQDPDTSKILQSPKPADLIPPDLGTTLHLKLPPVIQSSSSASPISPGVQDKIEQIEKQSSSKLGTEPGAELVSKSRADKRKSESSPECAELSRKEKKVLREEEKKMDKMKKKLEFKEKNTILNQINHSY